MAAVKKIFRRVYLIPVFYGFSVLSFLVGIFLLIYFIKIFSGYFEKLDTGELIIIKAAQEVDFMGLLYGTIWSFFGFFFFILSLRLQMVEMKFRLNHYESDPLKFRDEMFETEFLKLTRHQLEVFSELSYRGEVISESERHRIVDTVINGEKFIDHFLDQMKVLLKALEKGTFPTNENDYNALKSKWIFTQLSISENKFSKLLERAGDNEKERIRIAYHEVYVRYHYYLNPYFENLTKTLSLIEDAMDKELEEQNVPENEVKAKYIRFSEFVKAHLTHPELTIAFYHSFEFPEFKDLCRKLRLFENLPALGNIDQMHQKLF